MLIGDRGRMLKPRNHIISKKIYTRNFKRYGLSK